MQATLTQSDRRSRGALVPPQPPSLITGGFIQLGVAELTLAWTAYTLSHITALDLRVWLASLEVKKRRSWLKRGQSPHWTAKELHALVGGGGGERGIRRSTRKLRNLGLLTWTKDGPQFASKPHELTVDLSSEVEAMRALMPYKRRFVPLPRRMLRLLAGGVKRSVLATTLGHASRCIYRKDSSSGWSGDGACSASWIAETFGVGESSVRKARAHLRDELGWLTSLHDRSQWFVNSHGGRFEVNLSWERPELREAAEEAPQPCAVIPAQVGPQEQPPEFSTGKMRGPLPENESVLRGLREQTSLPKEEIYSSDPGSAPPEPPTDSWKQRIREAARTSQPAAPPPPSPQRSPLLKGARQTEGRQAAQQQPSPEQRTKPVNLHNVQLEDLRSTSRVMELFDLALTDRSWAKAGATPVDSWPERLNWAAAAARVRARGGTNPAGLFMHLVRKRKWGDVSNGDEDAVRQRMAEWRDGAPEGSYSHKHRCSEPDEEVLNFEQEEYLREQMLSGFKGW